MGEVKEDKSGIYSLGGFVFQIRVFLYYALQLNEGESLEFETLDDVNIKKDIDLDTKEDFFRTKLNRKSSNCVIQVKRTNITQEKAEGVLLNWILLEYSGQNIEEYILFADPSYDNNGRLKDINSEKLYEKIIASKETSSKSIKKKLKDIFKNNFDDFNSVIEKIKLKHHFLHEDKIDDLIIEKASARLKKRSKIDAIFYMRINSLRIKLTDMITESVNNKRSFSIDYSTQMSLESEIIKSVTDEFPMISYSDHKKTNPVELDKISELREVRQLKYCGLDDSGIKRRMYRCNFYSDYRFRLREFSKINIINELEDATFENFEDVKESLQYK